MLKVTQWVVAKVGFKSGQSEHSFLHCFQRTPIFFRVQAVYKVLYNLPSLNVSAIVFSLLLLVTPPLCSFSNTPALAVSPALNTLPPDTHMVSSNVRLLAESYLRILFKTVVLVYIHLPCLLYFYPQHGPSPDKTYILIMSISASPHYSVHCMLVRIFVCFVHAWCLHLEGSERGRERGSRRSQLKLCIVIDCFTSQLQI